LLTLASFIMSLERKLKIALDETRLLILGAQVLFGFQFNGAFQELFEQLPPGARQLQCAALLLIMTTIGLLIAPAMRHRIVEAGQASNDVLAAATIFAGLAMLPLALGLSLDLFVTLARIYGPAPGLFAGGAFFVLAVGFWYLLELLLRRNGKMAQLEAEKPTPLPTQVEQLLTEARVIIPGAQALLGFQFAVTLTRAFDQLSSGAKLTHVIALLCVALAVVLLMAPAALHRLSFRGEDSPAFVTIGSVFVIAAPAPLALGIALDTYVAARRSLDSDVGAIAAAALSGLLLFGLWYAYPLWRRHMRGQASARMT
jgi:Family of unknown function (DUF6328)